MAPFYGDLVQKRMTKWIFPKSCILDSKQDIRKSVDLHSVLYK